MDKVERAKTNFAKGIKSFQVKDFGNAEFFFEETLKDAPTSSPTLENLSRSYLKNNKFDKAEEKLLFFISLNKDDDAIAYELLFELYLKKNENEKLKDLFAKGTSKNKFKNEYVVKYNFFYPSFFNSINEIKKIRNDFIRKIEESLINKNFPKLDIDKDLLKPANFLLSYDGLENLEISKKLVKLYKKTYPFLNTNFQITDNKKDKIKIGFISEFFTDHTIMKLFKGLIYKLDKEKFEVFVFYSEATRPGKRFEEIKESLVLYNYNNIFLPKNAHDKINVIKDKNLDIIFYPDIHMSTNLYYLTLLRLAKHQITSWGHPETTGNENIDYFLSSKLLETEGYQNKYSEKVLLSEYLPMYFFKPSVPFDLTNDQLKQKNHYFCPQSLFKMHPKFDLFIKRILDKDKKGIITFVKDREEILSKLFYKRLNKNLSNNIERIKFIDRLTPLDFIQYCGRASVLLDPYWFGAGNSFHESMYYGTPTVSMPTDYMKSRVVTGAYKQMNIKNPPVVNSEEEYADTCVEIANNGDIDLKMYYKEQADKYLFENEKFIKNVEEIFISIVK